MGFKVAKCRELQSIVKDGHLPLEHPAVLKFQQWQPTYRAALQNLSFNQNISDRTLKLADIMEI